MIATLAWKEYREQRGLWLAIALLAILFSINLGFIARGGLAGAHNDPFVSDVMHILLFSLMVAQGVVCGTQLLAGEKDAGTADFLNALRSRRYPLWQTKLLVGVLCTFLQAVVVFGILLFLQMGTWSEFLWVLVVGWLALFWGMVGGALCNHMFPAILSGIVLAAANFTLLFLVPVGREAVQILAAVVALLLSYRTFCSADLDRRQRDEKLQRKRLPRQPYGWQTLIWLAEKQGRWIIWPGLALSFVAGFFLVEGPQDAYWAAGTRHMWTLHLVLTWEAPQDGYWAAGTWIIGLACGLAAFVPEQTGEQERFLGAQRFPPGRVWFVKTLFWAAVATGMAGLLSLALHYRTAINSSKFDFTFQGTFFSMGQRWLFLIEWALYSFCFGQFCALLSRKIVVTGMLAFGISLLFLAMWLPSLIIGGIYAWQILGLPLILAAATRLSMWPWYSGRLYTRRHILGVGTCALLTGLWLGGSLWYRAVEIPNVGEPFDLQVFYARLQKAARSEADVLMRRGVKAMEDQRNTVREKMGPPTKLLFPLPPDAKNLPYYLKTGNYLAECEEVLFKGWPIQDEEINRWLDAMFAGDWPKEFRTAAKMPLGLVVDPRTFHWIYVEKEGKQSFEPSVNLMGFRDVGNLFAARVLQMQARGDDDAALDYWETLLGVSRQLNHCVPQNMAWNSRWGLEWTALRDFDRWLEKVGPRQEPLRRALELLQYHAKEFPDPLDSIRADYIVARNHPISFWRHPSGAAGLEYTLVKLALETPWEGERHSRFINAWFQGRLRLAELDERTGWVYGLNLIGSGWTGERWRQLMHDFSGAIRGPLITPVDAGRNYQQNLRIRQVYVALMLYQAEKGHAATKLDDLSPRFLESVPGDPLEKEPFHYKVSAGEEISGHFPIIGHSPQKLRPGQGVLWLESRLEDKRTWFPVPVWEKK